MRLDTKIPLKDLHLAPIKIKIDFLEPAGCELQIHWEPGSRDTPYKIKALFLDSQGETSELKEIEAKKIVEAALPFSLLNVKNDESAEFSVSVLKEGVQIEHWPYQSSIRFKRPSEDFGSEFWNV